jgi:hypothetical protein
MHLFLYMQLLWPLRFPLRVIVGISLQSARAVALVIVNMLIAADIGSMPIFAAFLAWRFQEPAVIFYVSVTLTVSAALAGLLTVRLVTDVGLQIWLVRGALSQ